MSPKLSYVNIMQFINVNADSINYCHGALTEFMTFTVAIFALTALNEHTVWKQFLVDISSLRPLDAF
jgi:hypothetical protein